MAARQKETEHLLDDGFVVAWDSSEIDEELRLRLLQIAEEEMKEIFLELEPEVAAGRSPADSTAA